MKSLLTPEVWSALRPILQVAFFLSILTLLKTMLDVRGQAQLRHLSRPKGAFRLPMAVILIGFTGLLVYQATWQLTGIFRPQFISFMQLHDRREFNPAHWIKRGRILDHRGQVLAYSRTVKGEVLRIYPDGPVFAPVVGYSDPRFGAAGMESAANLVLNGGAPGDLEDWSKLGQQIVAGNRHPQGRDLVLTLDAELQRTAVQLLGKRKGAAVAIEPSSGAVRVLASTPSFDPNRIEGALFEGDDPDAPLLNRATQGLYPPGSTFKIALASMALDRGFSGTINCPADGFTTSSRYAKIRDHEYYSARARGAAWRGHGRIDLARALADSSNVFFAQLGVRYGQDAFYQLIDRIRLGQSIALYASPNGRWTMSTGRLPRLSAGDQYGLAQLSIGQGRLLVTPAFMAMLTSAVANDGVAMKPRMVEADQAQALGPFMSATTARRLLPMLRRVVTQGTGRSIDTPALAIAGKTGTAQNPQGQSHSWFVGLAPAERPQLAVAILVEHGGYGSGAAAQVARDLLLRAQAIGLIR